MRILVFFDLPVVKPSERKVYTHFRRFLLNDGYDMLQFSVYARFCNSYDAVEKHMQRLIREVPKKGSVRVMVVTDKQYGEMKLLVGIKTSREKKGEQNQLMFF